MDRAVPFISRVRLKNYKSIAECDVRLGPLTVLIGPNGSGKSNFLQALALLSRAVNTTPFEAIDELGGLGEIVRRAPEPAESFSIDVEARVPWSSGQDTWASVGYGFEIGMTSGRGLRSFDVIRETAELRAAGQVWRFQVQYGEVDDDLIGGPAPGIERDRLYLPAAALNRIFGPLFADLTGMRFYSFALDTLRELARPSEGALLDSRGEHLGDVLAALAVVEPDLKHRIDAYLNAAVPGITSVEARPVGGYVDLVFRATSESEDEGVEFGPAAVSDGTIRATAVLAAMFQLAAVDGRISLVGIEEPEIALHPAAAGVLFDALTEASERVQVLVTSQSPDLLDRDDLDVSDVRAVSMQNGVTVIGEVDRASRQIVRDKLYTLGELMRSNQISPEPATDPEA